MHSSTLTLKRENTASVLSAHGHFFQSDCNGDNACKHSHPARHLKPPTSTVCHVHSELSHVTGGMPARILISPRTSCNLSLSIPRDASTLRTPSHCLLQGTVLLPYDSLTHMAPVVGGWTLLGKPCPIRSICKAEHTALRTDLPLAKWEAE